MHLFIDTNILLAFYEYSSDDLEELRKLIGLVQSKRVTLHLTDQVTDEFRRNREKQIASAVKALRGQRLALQFPVLCREYPQYDALRSLQRRYQSTHQELLDRLLRDGENHELKADEVIEELFAAANRVATGGELISRAGERVGLGNPPGKSGSLGDAVNWEALLAAVPNGQDLCFVTDDGDYLSQLSRERFDEFLSLEWARRKNSNIRVYQKLSAFFGDYFPNIRLADELEKDLLIGDLAQSGSFAATHSIVAKLRQYSEFTAAQRNAIASGVVNNDQVHWILGDWDVNDLVHRVIDGHETVIDSDLLAEIRSMLEIVEEEEAPSDDYEEDDLPF